MAPAPACRPWRLRLWPLGPLLLCQSEAAVSLAARRGHLDERAHGRGRAVSVAVAAVPARRARAEGGGLALARATAHSKWNDPDFFGSFSEGESTYDEDADFGRAHLNDNPSAKFVDGWEPHIDAAENPPAVSADWYHESPSGNSQAAWQTHYPAAQGTAQTGEWYRSEGGAWHQDYRGEEAYDTSGPGNWLDGARSHEAIPSGWFDASVQQFDSFGRRKAPSPSSGRRLVGWEERAVNATFACDTAGCTATGPLRAFDGEKERAIHCRLNVAVKATDYDDPAGGKYVEWVSVNDVKVAAHCELHATGCNITDARPLYPCAVELDVDKLMTPTGTLQISAKNSDAVTECPYEGHLLYGVATVTCMVQNQLPMPA